MSLWNRFKYWEPHWHAGQVAMFWIGLLLSGLLLYFALLALDSSYSWFWEAPRPPETSDAEALIRRQLGLDEPSLFRRGLFLLLLLGVLLGGIALATLGAAITWKWFGLRVTRDNQP